MKKISLLLNYLLLLLLSANMNAQTPKYEQIMIHLEKANFPNSQAELTTPEAINLTRLFMQQKGIQRCESDLKHRKFVLVFAEDTDIKFILNQSEVADELYAMGYQIGAIADAKFAMQQKTPPTIEPIPEKTEPVAVVPLAKSENNVKTATARKLSKKAAQKASEKVDEQKKSSELQEKNKLDLETIEANSDSSIPQPAPAKDCDDCGEQKISSGLRDEVLKKADYGGDAMDFGSGGDEGATFDDSSLDGNNKLTEEQLDSLRQLINQDTTNPPNH